MYHYTLNDFPDEETCLEWLKNQRWSDGIYCVKCQKITQHHLTISRKYYTCQKCGHHVYPTADTIFHKSSTPLTTWFYVLYRIVETGGEITARRIQQETGVTYKTAWRMRKLLLEQMQEDNNLLPFKFNPNQKA